MQAVREKVDADAARIGVDIVDVRVKRVELRLEGFEAHLGFKAQQNTFGLIWTKSGGFGKPDALIQIVDNLTCATSY